MRNYKIQNTPQGYEDYLNELLQKDNITPTPEFLEGFRELINDGIIGGVSDYKGVMCYYEWNKKNLQNNESKETFINKYILGVNAI